MSSQKCILKYMAEKSESAVNRTNEAINPLRNPWLQRRSASIAQWLERWSSKPEAGSSILPGGNSFPGVTAGFQLQYRS